MMTTLTAGAFQCKHSVQILKFYVFEKYAAFIMIIFNKKCKWQWARYYYIIFHVVWLLSWWLCLAGPLHVKMVHCTLVTKWGEQLKKNSVWSDKQGAMKFIAIIISTAQPPGVPEICKKSLSACPCTGGMELFVLGKNFLKDTRVVFQDGDALLETPWEESVQPDKEFLQQACGQSCELGMHIRGLAV